jgi:Arc/MetJ-type ribon-helix-helix transcriptional regulator
MTILLPEDLERYVRSQVQNGYFASEDEAISEAVRLLRRVKPAGSGAGKALTEDELERQMVQSGFLARVPSRQASAGPREFRPIAIEGEPLSETVIRERR